MNFYLFVFAAVTAVSADVSHLPSAYLPPEQEEPITLNAPVNDYLPPVQQVQPEEPNLQDVQYQVPNVQVNSGHVLTDDGYHYKTNRRVVYRFRHRRDVSDLPQNQYLPPTVYQGPSVDVPNNQYLAPSPVAPSAPLAIDHPELVQGVQHDSFGNVVQVYNQAPLPEVQPVPEAEPAHNLAEDGYHYKTNRRVVYRHRHRRDVSHVPQYQYLPPAKENFVEVPNNQYLAPSPLAPSFVPEAPVAPAAPATPAVPVPSVDSVAVSSPIAPSFVPEAPTAPVSSVDSTPASNVVQRDHHSNVAVVYNSTPAEEIPQVDAPRPVEPIPAHTLAEDGYHYKTNRRVVYRFRHRRDVSDLPSNDYLPPGQEISAEAPNNEYLAPVTKVSSAHEEAEPAHTVSDDGYRYKTQRRVVYRRQ